MAINTSYIFLDIQIGSDLAGRLEFELFSDKAPKTCEHFRALCTGRRHIRGSKFSRSQRVIGFRVNTKDTTRGYEAGASWTASPALAAGSSASNVAGSFVQGDENLDWREPDSRGFLCMSNIEKGTTHSGFFITLAPCPNLKGKHTIFGRLISGLKALNKVVQIPVESSNKSLTDVVIIHSGELKRIEKPQESEAVRRASEALEAQSLDEPRKFLDFYLQKGSMRMVQVTLKQHFEFLSQGNLSWIAELKDVGWNIEEISEVLMDEYNNSPWIYQPPRLPLVHSIKPNFHRNFCVHDRNTTEKRKYEDNHVEQSSVNLHEFIAEYCGIGGIFPQGRESSKWPGTLSFGDEDHSVGYITYKAPDEESHDGLDIHKSEICSVLSSFCAISGFLQSREFCCDYFTILRSVTSSADRPIVELCRVDFVLGSQLLDLLRGISPNSADEDIVACHDKAIEIIRVVLNPSQTRAPLIPLGAGYYPRLLELLHVSSLASQLLTCGLLSFAQAHTGRVRPYFLTRPLQMVYLRGNRTGGSLSGVLKPARLSCLGRMIKDSVMVFSINLKSPDEVNATDEAKYDLLGSIEDVSETWDATKLIMDTTQPYGDKILTVEIGGGSISISARDQDISPKSGRLPQLHWSAEVPKFGTTPKTFDLWTKYLIGITSPNPDCPLDEEQSWSYARDLGHMIQVGTKPNYWELKERRGTLHTSQYMGIQLNQSWRKRLGVTLKERMLELPDDEMYSFLEAPWGLQVSLCTGVARRVSLFELLADVMCCFVESLCPVPPEWYHLKDRQRILEEIKGPNPREWISRLEQSLVICVHNIIRKILVAFKETGIDQKGQNLLIAWPNQRNPYMGLRIPCQGLNLWTQILRDSEECATFAYITPTCLESRKYICRGLKQADFHYTSAWLDTAVCRYIQNPRQGSSINNQLTLTHGAQYWIGCPDLLLKAKASVEPESQISYLYVSTSLISEKIRSRLNGLKRRFPQDRLRERFMADARAQSVAILANS